MTTIERNAGPPVSPHGGRQEGRCPAVPYITAWSAEDLATTGLVILPGNKGIGYNDETPLDRDHRGILLKRTRDAQGHGRPVFGEVHAARQRRAMSKLLCQVCGNAADRNRDGILWLLKDHRADWPDWPNRMGCTEPPVCVDCAGHSTRMCPALRKGYVLARVRSAPIAAVHGALYGPSPFGTPAPLDAATIPFDDPLVHWVLASHVVRELRQATLLD